MNPSGRIQERGQDQMQEWCFHGLDWKGVPGATPLYFIACVPAPQTSSPAADTFLHYRTSKVRALRAARLERLVRELVSGDREQDPGFVPAFLATHRAFVPTARVLGLLLPPPPPPLPSGLVPGRPSCSHPRPSPRYSLYSLHPIWNQEPPPAPEPSPKSPPVPFFFT